VCPPSLQGTHCVCAPVNTGSCISHPTRSPQANHMLASSIQGGRVQWFSASPAHLARGHPVVVQHPLCAVAPARGISCCQIHALCVYRQAPLRAYSGTVQWYVTGKGICTHPSLRNTPYIHSVYSYREECLYAHKPTPPCKTYRTCTIQCCTPTWIGRVNKGVYNA
jgi:hypothetical protein